MKLISQFICDACNQPINLPDGIVIWDNKEYQVSLFVAHNWPECRTENTFEKCPLSCTLRGFIASNGLREYFSLLIAAVDFSQIMKRFMEKGLIKPNIPDLSVDDLIRRPIIETWADMAVRRAHLRRSIVESVARFFDDFVEDKYFLNDEELAKAIRQDLEGEGPVYV